MFSFYAFFWNNDVYINEKQKYAANEILTAYLSKNCLEEAEDYIYELKKLCRRLILSPDMDFEFYENYNNNVCDASELLADINTKWLLKLPPYNSIFRDSIRTLEDVLNEYSSIFDDGIESDDKTITWETITPTGYGEQTDDGDFIIHLTKFNPDPLEFIYEYDDDMQAKLYYLNKEIKTFFNGYIHFLEAYRTVHHIFKPFLTEYLLQKDAFPQESDLARYFERYSKEHHNPFGSFKCNMNSFGYKVLKDTHSQPILCETMQFTDLQSFLFYDFFNGVKRNFLPNQCKQCGRFFLIQAGKYYSYCDRQVKGEPGKTCRDIGARKRYDDKCKTDPVWQTYNRAYKAHYARYMKKKMTVAEFEQWSRMASQLRDKAIADEISYERYYEEIRK